MLLSRHGDGVKGTHPLRDTSLDSALKDNPVMALHLNSNDQSNAFMTLQP